MFLIKRVASTTSLQLCSTLNVLVGGPSRPFNSVLVALNNQVDVYSLVADNPLGGLSSFTATRLSATCSRHCRRPSAQNSPRLAATFMSISPLIICGPVASRRPGRHRVASGGTSYVREIKPSMEAI